VAWVVAARARKSQIRIMGLVGDSHMTSLVRGVMAAFNREGPPGPLRSTYVVFTPMRFAT